MSRNRAATATMLSLDLLVATRSLRVSTIRMLQRFGARADESRIAFSAAGTRPSPGSNDKKTRIDRSS